MPDDNQPIKSMISGGNTENLKSETPPPAPTAEETLYPDPKVEEAAKTEEGEAQVELTPEQKAEAEKKVADDKAAADKAEADRIAAMTPEEKAAHDKEIADKKAAEDAANKKDPVDLTGMVLPEGFKPDDAIMADLTKLAGEIGLDKEGAEKLAPVGAKLFEQGGEAATKQINEGYEAIRADWREQVANDPVLGSREQMAVADAGLEAYGTPALRQLLDDTGIGDHPEIIRAFHKIGKTVKQDQFERGGSGDTQRSNAADVMYPTMKT